MKRLHANIVIPTSHSAVASHSTRSLKMLYLLGNVNIVTALKTKDYRYSESILFMGFVTKSNPVCPNSIFKGEQSVRAAINLI